MKKTEFLVLCDKATGTARNSQSILELELDTSPVKKKGKGKDKIYLDTNNIEKLLTNNLSPVILDLLEIATFVYVAGQLTTRGGLKEFEYGAKWFRHFEMVIPVRETAVWNYQKELLQELLDFVSGESYVFTFVNKNSNSPSWFNYQAGLEPEKDYTDVVLLSGGLDSFTGAMEEMASNNKTIFVSHQSETKMTSLQNKVFEYVISHSNSQIKPFHVPVKIYKGETYITKDTNQRSRSFLFAALGAVVADCLGLDKVKFYENGIISCNLPFDGQTYQAQRTRSTHPKFLKPMSRLLSQILNKDFHFINPFFDKTRSEVVKHLLGMQHQSGIGTTRSCASSRYQDGWRHDGTCSQCVDRRFATLANNCLQFDLWKDYRLNIFRDELECTYDRTMVYNYAAMAQKIMRIQDGAQFSKEYSSDIWDIVNYLDKNREEGILQIFNLYKRHAEGVLDVLKSQMTENAADYVSGRLPANCLIKLIGLDQAPIIRIRKSKKIKSDTSIETKFKKWDSKQRACFVISNTGIRFYYKDEIKRLPFRKGSHADKLLPMFKDGSLTSQEIKEHTESKDNPRLIVRNINRTINQHLRKVGHTEINEIGFISFDKTSSSYSLYPKIVDQKVFDQASQTVSL
jgi:7-cyano-7-deazaguanine synthase in queuosine biosynthesis